MEYLLLASLTFFWCIVSPFHFFYDCCNSAILCQKTISKCSRTYWFATGFQEQGPVNFSYREFWDVPLLWAKFLSFFSHGGDDGITFGKPLRSILRGNVWSFELRKRYHFPSPHHICRFLTGVLLFRDGY